MSTLRKRLEKQKGTASGRQTNGLERRGTSPFGAFMATTPKVYASARNESRHQPRCQGLDKRDSKTSTIRWNWHQRNIKVALKRLRVGPDAGEWTNSIWAVTIAPRRTRLPGREKPGPRAAQCSQGLACFLDIGGSMDPHIKNCRRTVQRRQIRISKKHRRTLLFPQLSLRRAFCATTGRRWTDKLDTLKFCDLWF